MAFLRRPRLLLPVPYHRVVLLEQLVEAELLRRRAAAYADGRAVDFAVEVSRRLRAGREDFTVYPLSFSAFSTFEKSAMLHTPLGKIQHTLKFYSLAADT